jgi:hypothetical protein
MITCTEYVLLVTSRAKRGVETPYLRGVYEKILGFNLEPQAILYTYRVPLTS